MKSNVYVRTRTLIEDADDAMCALSRFKSNVADYKHILEKLHRAKHGVELLGNDTVYRLHIVYDTVMNETYPRAVKSVERLAKDPEAQSRVTRLKHLIPNDLPPSYTRLLEEYLILRGTPDDFETDVIDRLWACHDDVEDRLTPDQISDFDRAESVFKMLRDG